jgi:heat-inducible transcriptional repressor
VPIKERIMLNERRRIVLAALVDEYVASAQPVASRRLVDHYKVGCSPATVRNDLAHLEETGHVFQPHVSAGRIPTDSGYRAFVDDIGERERRVALTAEEVEAIHSCYARVESQLSDLMRETSALLSKLTSYVAVVLAPVLRRSRIKRVDLVPLTARRALLVVITETGRVADRQVEFDADVAEDDLGAAERYLNETFDGKLAEDLPAAVLDAPRGPWSPVVHAVLGEVLDCLGEVDEEQLYSGGTTTLLEQPEFADSRTVRPLLSLLEDGFAMLSVLSEALEAKEVVVRIGRENRAAGLEHVSFVATNYGGEAGEGIVGLIGPTRMDYPRAIGAVRCVADSLSEALGQ